MLKTSRSRRYLVNTLIALVMLAVVVSGPILTWGVGGAFTDPYAIEFLLTVVAWVVGIVVIVAFPVMYGRDVTTAINGWIDAGDDAQIRQGKQAKRITQLETQVAELVQELKDLKDPQPQEPGRYAQPPYSG